MKAVETGQKTGQMACNCVVGGSTHYEVTVGDPVHHGRVIDISTCSCNWQSSLLNARSLSKVLFVIAVVFFFIFIGFKIKNPELGSYS